MLRTAVKPTRALSITLALSPRRIILNIQGVGVRSDLTLRTRSTGTRDSTHIRECITTDLQSVTIVRGSTIYIPTISSVYLGKIRLRDIIRTLWGTGRQLRAFYTRVSIRPALSVSILHTREFAWETEDRPCTERVTIATPMSQQICAFAFSNINLRSTPIRTVAWKRRRAGVHVELPRPFGRNGAGAFQTRSLDALIKRESHTRACVRACAARQRASF